MAQSKKKQGGRGWKQGIDPKFIGRRIEEKRELAALTQEQVAAKIGRHQSNLSSYETGASVPTLDTLRRLAVVLGTSVDTLIGVDAVRDQILADAETPHPSSAVMESRPPRHITSVR